MKWSVICFCLLAGICNAQDKIYLGPNHELIFEGLSFEPTGTNLVRIGGMLHNQTRVPLSEVTFKAAFPYYSKIYSNTFSQECEFHIKDLVPGIINITGEQVMSP